MRKGKLEKLLKETNNKLEFTMLENRQLHERINEYQKIEEKSDEIANTNNGVLQSLENELQELKKSLENQKANFENTISELEERNNALNSELNHLKGEHFDTCKYADSLKEKLDAIKINEVIETIDIEQPISPPPVVEDVKPQYDSDSETFEYASAIISKTVIKTATVKSILTNSNDKYAAELVTLALGKSEMVKSDVLQTVMSEMLPEAKKQRMDTIYNEACEYFDGLTGQLRE